jgi:hypothetical protein
MRSRASIATLLAIALLSLPAVSGVATADGTEPRFVDPKPGSAVAELGPKNYAKNGASGDFAGSEAEAALIRRGLALNEALAAPAARAEADDGFAWDDAAVGAGVALALIGLACLLLVARRRITARGAEPVRTWSS